MITKMDLALFSTVQRRIQGFKGSGAQVFQCSSVGVFLMICTRVLNPPDFFFA